MGVEGPALNILFPWDKIIGMHGKKQDFFYFQEELC